MALYGTPVAVYGTGYGSMGMPANLVYSAGQHKWFVQVLGTPNASDAAITVVYSKLATVV